MSLKQQDIHKKRNSTPFFYTTQKIYSRNIIALKIKTTTVKHLEKILETIFKTFVLAKLSQIGLSTNCRRNKINKQDLFKIQNFCSSKFTIKKNNRQATSQEKMFQYIYYKGHFSLIKDNPLKCIKYLNRHFTKRDRNLQPTCKKYAHHYQSIEKCKLNPK